MITASGGRNARPDLAAMDPTGVAPVAAMGDPYAVEGTGIGLEIAALWSDPMGDRGHVLGGKLEGSLGAGAEAAHAVEVAVRVPIGTPARAAPAHLEPPATPPAPGVRPGQPVTGHRSGDRDARGKLTTPTLGPQAGTIGWMLLKIS